MTKFIYVLTCLLSLTNLVDAKEIALTFDDAPVSSSKLFQSQLRTNELVRKLKQLNVPSVMIFANPCNGIDETSMLAQLKVYQEAGHMLGNHTCSHPRLDDVGFEQYSKDAFLADKKLNKFLNKKKFFRFPYLNEGTKEDLRDQMRGWLELHGYKNGYVSVDNDDYYFSFMLQKAANLGKTIDHKQVKDLLVEHILAATEFYDDLAIKHLGYSPKHVLLLHEMDATVMYLGDIVEALRRKGWKIISAAEAYTDPLYSEKPKNLYANNGIIAQLVLERKGVRAGYAKLPEIKAELERILRLPKE